MKSITFFKRAKNIIILLILCSPFFKGYTQGSWEEATSSAGWSTRNLHTSVVFENKIWVLGGWDGSRKNDVWSSSDGIHWTEETSSADWSRRSHHTSVVFENKIWVIGGQDGPTKNDVWSSSDGIHWTEEISSADWSRRSSYSSVVFENKIWVLGGFDGPGKNDVWSSSNGRDWTEETSSAGWDERSRHSSVVFDNKIWVLGGYDGSRKNDVWSSSNGRDWIRETSSAGWARRGEHSSVVFKNKIWVMGGAGNRRGFRDVWHYSGNNAPTDITLSSTIIEEGKAIGEVIGTLSTTDPDASDSHTYSLSGMDAGSFQIVGDQLQSAVEFDYETKSSYIITIQTEDAGGLTFQKDFTIMVNNVNENPTAINLSSTIIAENSSIGTQIGTLTTTDPDDPSKTDSYDYTLSGTDASSFEIVGNELQSNRMFDYEIKNSYTITIQTQDQDLGRLTYEEDFTIMVNDVDEKATNINLSATMIEENLPAGTAIGTLDNNDPDPGTYTYHLVSGGVYFRIDGTTLKSRMKFNYESGTNSYPIFIEAREDGSFSYSRSFTIDISNVNDRPNDITLSNATIEENLPIGTIIDILSTTDEDAGSHTYSLSGTDANSFRIVGEQLQSAVEFDYETKNSYMITIETEDLGNLTFQKDFIISINDVNDAPTDITLSNAFIEEGKAIGEMIGTLSTTDPDASDSHTYSLSGMDASSFEIVGNELRSAVVFDYSSKDSYDITIQTEDAGALTFSKDFTISLTLILQPVELVSFNTSLIENNAVLINWKTATELNSLRFDIEHSHNGTNFRKIQEIPAKGNSVSLQEYNTIHQYPIFGINYYRLKQIDLDDSFSYSFVSSLRIEGKENRLNITLYPNPVKEYIYLSMKGLELGELFEWRLINNFGSILSRGYGSGSGLHYLQLSTIPTGLYMLEIFSTRGNEHFKLLVDLDR